MGSQSFLSQDLPHLNLILDGWIFNNWIFLSFHIVFKSKLFVVVVVMQIFENVSLSFVHDITIVNTVNSYCICDNNRSERALASVCRK